jgi:hypothetical protein
VPGRKLEIAGKFDSRRHAARQDRSRWHTVFKGSIVITPDSSLRPGTPLVREWRGRMHTVVVMEEGFEYAGKTFPSLTKIAHAITGAHWSGPRFFGLIRKQASDGQLGSDATGSPGAEELANG